MRSTSIIADDFDFRVALFQFFLGKAVYLRSGTEEKKSPAGRSVFPADAKHQVRPSDSLREDGLAVAGIKNIT